MTIKIGYYDHFEAGGWIVEVLSKLLTPILTCILFNTYVICPLCYIGGMTDDILNMCQYGFKSLARTLKIQSPAPTYPNYQY